MCLLNSLNGPEVRTFVLFVLPPHTSHVTQPVDVGCSEPFQVKYSQECQAFSRTSGRVVTRSDVCKLACRAYTAALSPANIQAAFAKTGVFPPKSSSVMVTELSDKIAPSELSCADL